MTNGIRTLLTFGIFGTSLWVASIAPDLPLAVTPPSVSTRPGESSSVDRLRAELREGLREMHESHPTKFSVLEELADRGESLVPALTIELTEAKSDSEIVDLVQLAAVMHRSGAYDLHSDPKLVTAMESAVEAIRNQAIRARGRRIIDIAMDR